MFKRKSRHEVSYTDEGVSVRTDDMEFAAELVALWHTTFAVKPEEKPKVRLGFNNDHVQDSGLESDTERVAQVEDVEVDDEED